MEYCEEEKYWDQGVLSSVIDAPANCINGMHDPGTNQCLNAIPQGPGGTERNGRQVVLNDVSVKGQVRLAPETGLTGPDNVPRVFIALVLDTQTNGNQMLSEQCFSNPVGTGALATDIFINKAYESRFEILDTCEIGPQQYAGVLTMTNYPAGQVAENGVTVPFRLYADLEGIIVNYSSSGGIAGIRDNSLHIIAYANDITATPVLDYNSRVTFFG